MVGTHKYYQIPVTNNLIERVGRENSEGILRQKIGKICTRPLPEANKTVLLDNNGCLSYVRDGYQNNHGRMSSVRHNPGLNAQASNTKQKIDVNKIANNRQPHCNAPAS